MGKLKKIGYEYVCIVIGCFIASFGTAVLLLPNRLSTGGFSGIATIFFYLFEIPMGRTILILNIPFFIWGYIKIGKEFTVKTIIATTLYSEFINIFENNLLIKTDAFLGSVFGGSLAGIGLALVFKANASTGGSDLIAHIMQKYSRKYSLNNILTILDIIVISFNLIVFKDIEVGLYSIIAIYIDGKMIDFIFEGINFCKVVFIISDKHEEILKNINNSANKGATGIYGKGAYTDKEKIIIMTVIKKNDISTIKNIAVNIDRNAFIIISDAREVYGLGFKD